MSLIDAHQHFWKFDPVRDTWIDEAMNRIRRDFYPADIKALLDSNGFDGCISVQADQSLAENDFLVAQAENHDFIRGIIGWIDFQAANIHEQLDRYRELKIVKGFRHVLQGEKQRDFMLRPGFMRGIGAIGSRGYTYDILIYPDQLPYTKTFVEAFPNQPFVIDHLAKPHIKAGKLQDWKKDIQALSSYDHVYCKISGMVTEANWHAWTKEDFRPYIDTVVNAFGISRLMFASDWPVCLVAAEYAGVVDIVKDYFSTFSQSEQQSIFGGTAVAFYKL